MPIRLTVNPTGPPVEPTLFVLSPLKPGDEPLEKTAEDVCLATDIRPNDDNMALNVKDRKIPLSTTNAPLSTTDKTYVYAGFANETIYSCEMNNTSANNENVDICADLHPEKAKLNFYLLVMNGVRVVFTKSLAFSTILTIRAVLF